MRKLLWVTLIAGLLLIVYGFAVGNSAVGISPSVAIGGVLAFLSNYYLQLVAARSQRETEELRESRQAQDATIAAYTEKMSDLVIEQDVDERSKDERSNNPHVFRVAQALTISTLVQLDGERKRVVLKVAYSLGMIGTDNPLLDLGGASLDHADLSELRLREAYLRGTDLRGTLLLGADLTGSDLSYADLRGANLTYADLSAADLSGANLLPYDEQEPARLSLHNLRDFALPSDNYLRSLAKLQEERLRGLSLSSRLKNRLLLRMPVTFTNLIDTNLTSANLTGAILANADLRNIRGLTQEQIDSAIGNSETQVPNGLKLPEAWAKEIEVQINEVQMKVFHTE